MNALFLKPLHNFADVLRTVTGAEEQRVVGFDEDEIADADGGDKFLRAPEIVAVGIERERSASGNIRAALRRQNFVTGTPGADVAPTYLSGNHKHARRATSTRGRLHDGVIHRNIFQ